MKALVDCATAHCRVCKISGACTYEFQGDVEKVNILLSFSTSLCSLNLSTIILQIFTIYADRFFFHYKRRSCCHIAASAMPD